MAVMGLRQGDWRVPMWFLRAPPFLFPFFPFFPYSIFFWGSFFVCLGGFFFFGYFCSVHNIISYHIIIALDSQTRLSAVLGTGHTVISAASHRTRLG